MATTTPPAPPRGGTGHPVPDGVRALGSEISDLAGRSLFTMDAAAAREALCELAGVRARLDALTLAVAAHADRVAVGEDSGARTTGTWWAVATRQNRPTTAGLVALAHAVEDTWTAVGAGCATGKVSLEQARVIVHALDALPEDLDVALRDRAEEVMVAYAAEHDPATLRVLGHAILEAVAPDLVEAAEQSRLDKEEAAARVSTRLTMSKDGHGKVHGRFTIPEAQAAMFKKALWALASPRHRAAVEEHGLGADTESGVVRPTPEKMGHAFCALIEALPADRLPQAGGMDATASVICELATLRTGLGFARLDTGELISASQTRRMACNAKILPIVMNGPSQVLDVARAQRFHTRSMRHGANVRDGGCTAEGCDWPPGMCEMHHDEPWSEGGTTDLEHARLLCPHHHHRIHDPRYTHEIIENNKVRFHRRT